MNRVYVQTNQESYITAIDSDAFLSNLIGWTQIDAGDDWPKYKLAQHNYFAEPLMTAGGVYRYKLIDGKPVECTPEEIAEQEAKLPAPAPSIPDEIGTLKNENFMLKAQIQAMSDRNDFIEDCIAEMAMQVYA